jgi:trigger factor
MKDYEDAISQSSKQIDIKKLTEVISDDLLKEKLIIWLEENSEVKEKTSKATKTSKTTKATKTASKTTKTTKTTKTQNKKEKK